MSLTRRFLTGAVAAATASAFLFAAEPAAAQEEAANPNLVSPTGKGIAGGIMLGAEVGLITVGAIGVKEWWPYLLAGVGGGGLGAVGGYYAETATPSEPSLYMLAGGMALVIPTIVIIANATAYDPSEDEEEGEEASDGDPDSPTVETSWRRPAFALLDLDASGVGMRARPGIPAVSVAPMYSRQEVATYEVKQTAVVHVPLISGAF